MKEFRVVEVFNDYEIGINFGKLDRDSYLLRDMDDSFYDESRTHLKVFFYDYMK